MATARLNRNKLLYLLEYQKTDKYRASYRIPDLLFNTLTAFIVYFPASVVGCRTHSNTLRLSFHAVATARSNRNKLLYLLEYQKTDKYRASYRIPDLLFNTLTAFIVYFPASVVGCRTHSNTLRLSFHAVATTRSNRNKLLYLLEYQKTDKYRASYRIHDLLFNTLTAFILKCTKLMASYFP